jgi:hypothetical protein
MAGGGEDDAAAGCTLRAVEVEHVGAIREQRSVGVLMCEDEERLVQQVAADECSVEVKDERGGRHSGWNRRFNGGG